MACAGQGVGHLGSVGRIRLIFIGTNTIILTIGIASKIANNWVCHILFVGASGKVIKKAGITSTNHIPECHVLGIAHVHEAEQGGDISLDSHAIRLNGEFARNLVQTLPIGCSEGVETTEQ